MNAKPLEHFRDYLVMLARVRIPAALSSKLDASDIVQQTLLDAHRRLDQLKADDSAGRAAWLRTILAHNLADAQRKFNRGKRDVAREQASLDHASTRLAGWLDASPSAGLHREERAVQLSSALSALPEAQSQALVLKHWHDWPLADIAKHMDRSTAAVAGLLKRGLRTLRETIEEVEG
jgi:RNA polymerase sigma-70 factor (ECF subfamily)